jgi:hypothetical protein
MIAPTVQAYSGIVTTMYPQRKLGDENATTHWPYAALVQQQLARPTMACNTQSMTGQTLAAQAASRERPLLHWLA